MPEHSRTSVASDPVDRLPDISVVLASRNRAAQVGRLLDGLARQVGAPTFEVIIADNGSIDNTSDVIARAQGHLNIRAVREERRGKSRALNAALKLARGEIVVLTDDDIFPRPKWLASLYRAATDYGDCNVFGGRIDVDMGSVPSWVRQSFNLMGLLTSAHDKGDDYARYGYGDYPFGPNMAVRRSLLAGKQSPYPEHLGPGTDHPVGDETSFFLRISPPEATDRLFVPCAIVVHEVEPENVLFLNAVQRCYQAGTAHGRLGLPALARESGAARNPSTLRLIHQRIRTSRSARELVCITSRYLGYLHGRRLGPFAVSCTAETEV